MQQPAPARMQQPAPERGKLHPPDPELELAPARMQQPARERGKLHPRGESGRMRTGSQQRDVTVVAYDPSWPAAFEAEAARVRGALGDLLLRIDHVGSTSVPGLAAKPTVDMQASVADGPIPLHALAERLEPLGYVHVPFPNAADYPMFARPGDGHRLFHLHVCRAGGDEERRHLALREYLRAHRHEAAGYAETKLRLAAAHAGDRQAYVEAKDALVKALERRALEWAGNEKGRPSAAC